MFSKDSTVTIVPDRAPTSPRRNTAKRILSAAAMPLALAVAIGVVTLAAWIALRSPHMVAQPPSAAPAISSAPVQQAAEIVPQIETPPATDGNQSAENSTLESVPLPISRPSERLHGNWRRPNDGACQRPLTISVSGTALTYVRDGVTFAERIDSDEGSTVVATGSTRIDGIATPPRQFTFRLANGGRELHIANETWLRCVALDSPEARAP
jgi:hypothetical protein